MPQRVNRLDSSKNSSLNQSSCVRLPMHRLDEVSNRRKEYILRVHLLVRNCKMEMEEGNENCNLRVSWA